MDAELSEQLHYLAEKTLSRCIERARHYFERDFPVPALNYKLRGKAAGKAYLQTWEVRLNQCFLSRINRRLSTKSFPMKSLI
ncbi:protein sprT [Vibrio maritimus]|uniref:Protein sprT n=1 Tax=Vibrio maritimus TaxID=990268 RepID=A0A090SIT1_9VIBR|nr:protein sprT [Vibrio maritimus]